MTQLERPYVRLEQRQLPSRITVIIRGVGGEGFRDHTDEP